MTKREMYNHIAAQLPNDTDVVEFCQHELELLERRSSSASSKPTKTQQENVAFKAAMLDTLVAADRPLTISELMEQCAALAGLKNQRVNALMTQLKTEGKVTRTEIKKRAYFAVAA